MGGVRCQLQSAFYYGCPISSSPNSNPCAADLPALESSAGSQARSEIDPLLLALSSLASRLQARIQAGVSLTGRLEYELWNLSILALGMPALGFHNINTLLPYSISRMLQA